MCNVRVRQVTQPTTYNQPAHAPKEPLSLALLLSPLLRACSCTRKSMPAAAAGAVASVPAADGPALAAVSVAAAATAAAAGAAAGAFKLVR